MVAPGEYEFGIYEVYYDDNGQIKWWTENSMVPTCQSEKGLLEEMKIMERAFEQETLIYEDC